MPLETDLIYDVGMHTGEDTSYYLHSGNRVLAIEANPQQVRNNRHIFQPFLESGQLQIVNAAIWDDDDREIDFHISKVSAWCSFDKEVANRQGNFQETVPIRTTTLATLFAKYGVPIYCKLDIENADHKALLSLQNLSVLPKFISTETDCCGDDKVCAEVQREDSFTLLRHLGYTAFKLIDQLTLRNMEADKPMWRWKRSDLRYKLARKFSEHNLIGFRNLLCRRMGYKFPYGSSGPWGEHTPGQWHTAEKALQVYEYHRAHHVAVEGSSPYGFWCDWHATRAS